MVPLGDGTTSKWQKLYNFRMRSYPIKKIFASLHRDALAAHQPPAGKRLKSKDY